jgi:hypothetical protein
MYQVNINAHPKHFLDWHLPFSQQSDHVKEAFKNAVDEASDKSSAALDFYRALNVRKNPSFLNKSGEDMYNAIMPTFGESSASAMTASKLLSKHGVKGIKYFDSNSRSPDAKDKKQNYVVFDPKDIQIMKRYAQGGDVSAWHPNHKIHKSLIYKAGGGYVTG